LFKEKNYQYFPAGGGSVWGAQDNAFCKPRGRTAGTGKNDFILRMGLANLDHWQSDMRTKKYYAAYEEKTHNLDQAALWSARKKVLIVDDDFAFADLTRMYLEQNGYQVEMAADGVQAIKKIMVQDYLVILCDIVMPNLAGDMFYVAVERVKPHLCKHIVFVTGQQGDRKLEEFIRKIRGLILWKPFQPHVLIETIQAVEKKVRGDKD
jgi:CheY-like chemotaxis protein